MPITTRFFTAKVNNFVNEATGILTKDAEAEYKLVISEVAEGWGNKIRASGRGGSHNAQMSRIETSISGRGGKFFMRVGWLGSPPMAADGKTTWFVYHDTGYDLFGGGRTFIPGLFLQLDARQKLQEGIRDANARLVARVERAARKVN